MDFTTHEIDTVREKGWNSFTNGKLIELMLADNFHALLTFDKNLQHQQNFSKYPITVFVLAASNNTYEELSPLTPLIIRFYLQKLYQTEQLLSRLKQAVHKHLFFAMLS